MHRFGSFRARALAFTAVIALVAIASISTSVAPSATEPSTRALSFAKIDDERHDLAGIPNEGPEDSYQAQQAALRAYPGDNVPPEAAINAQATFQSLKKSGKPAGQWTAIGPLNQAKYPGVLDVFLFDGAEFTASGRVTAMAIAPTCTQAQCRLYI